MPINVPVLQISGQEPEGSWYTWVIEFLSVTATYTLPTHLMNNEWAPYTTYSSPTSLDCSDRPLVKQSVSSHSHKVCNWVEETEQMFGFLHQQTWRFSPAWFFSLVAALTRSSVNNISLTGPTESTPQPIFCTICILAGFDDIKMWALLLTGENGGTEDESNVCFSHMNFTCGGSQVTWLRHNISDESWK